eukprot:TRINITY_DN894_c0_g1_i10.p1 TRINITY_DN894_c0_g1~~TRINITY_DN894_c0_g1_i10.p1  ORF type:complete len:192 (+),score=26.28 TRINITY_DN894_c0_g1_i10:248-823(+)
MHKHRGVAGIRNSALAALAVRRLKNAHRRIEYANGDVYEGQFGGDIYKAHGQGEFLFASGGKYTGGFVGGKFDGAGTCQYADGSQYEGEWAMGAQQGGGTFRYVSGNVYTGQFVKGSLTGLGKMVYNNGDTYEGMFDNARMVSACRHELTRCVAWRRGVHVEDSETIRGVLPAQQKRGVRSHVRSGDRGLL